MLDRSGGGCVLRGRDACKTVVNGGLCRSVVWLGEADLPRVMRQILIPAVACRSRGGGAVSLSVLRILRILKNGAPHNQTRG